MLEIALMDIGEESVDPSLSSSRYLLHLVLSVLVSLLLTTGFMLFITGPAIDGSVGPKLTLAGKLLVIIGAVLALVWVLLVIDNKVRAWKEKKEQKKKKKTAMLDSKANSRMTTKSIAALTHMTLATGGIYVRTGIQNMTFNQRPEDELSNQVPAGDNGSLGISSLVTPLDTKRSGETTQAGTDENVWGPSLYPPSPEISRTSHDDPSKLNANDFENISELKQSNSCLQAPYRNDEAQNSRNTSPILYPRALSPHASPTAGHRRSPSPTAPGSIWRSLSPRSSPTPSHCSPQCGGERHEHIACVETTIRDHYDKEYYDWSQSLPQTQFSDDLF